jgi:hypothetical protein
VQTIQGGGGGGRGGGGGGEEEEEENTYIVSPPINIHWSVATVITAMAVTSLGMLGILCIIMWLI